MKRKRSTFAAALVAVVALGASASFSFGSSVLVNSTFQGGAQGTYSESTQPDWFSSSTISSTTLSGAGFSASGSDKLVVSIATKNGSSPGGSVTSMTYDGSSLSPVGLGTTTFSRTYQNLFYLDNVASDGDLSINFSKATEAYAVYLFALDGTAAGVGNTISEQAANATEVTSPTLTSTTDNAFLLWEVDRNSGGSNPLAVASTSGSASYDTQTSSYGGRGKSMAVWTTGENAGDYTITVNGSNGTGGFVGASFEAATSVPAPASGALALLGLGVLLVASRRRKHA